MSKAYVKRVKAFALTHLTPYKWGQLLPIGNDAGYQSRGMTSMLVNASSVKPLALTKETPPALPGLAPDRRAMNLVLLELKRSFTCRSARHLSDTFPSERRSEIPFSIAFPGGNFLVTIGKNTLHWPFLFQRMDEDTFDPENSSVALSLFEQCHRFGLTVIPVTMWRNERTSRKQRSYFHRLQINRKTKRYTHQKTFVRFSNKRKGKASHVEVKGLILMLGITFAHLQQLLALFAVRLPP